MAQEEDIARWERMIKLDGKEWYASLAGLSPEETAAFNSYREKKHCQNKINNNVGEIDELYAENSFRITHEQLRTKHPMIPTTTIDAAAADSVGLYVAGRLLQVRG